MPTLFQWYASDDAGGTNKAAIVEATAQTFQLTTAQRGKFITFEVLPVATYGTVTGTPVESLATDAVAAASTSSDSSDSSTTTTSPVTTPEPTITANPDGGIILPE